MNSVTPNRLPIDPNLMMEDVVRDPNIDLALKMASDIYDTDVKGFYNNTPYFSDTTTKEKRYIYILARALGLWTLKKIEADKECEALRVSLKEMIEYLEDEISDESEIIDQKLYEIYKAKVARAKKLLEEK